jgi:pimeloyl-ACP methyl ester carboxylesterase
MASFLLVHGAWQGAWCWREIIPRLESLGHRAVAIDLPGHGQDPTPRNSIALRDYVEAVVRALDGIGEPPLLVGHSMGGLISEVAEAVPHRLRGLIYVSALLLPNGSSMMQMVGRYDPECLRQIAWADDRRTALLTPRGAAEFLYSLCSPEIVQDAISRFTPEPVAPFEQVLCVTPERFGSVARYYVECLRDRIVAVALQREMHSSLPCKDVYSIDADHSPFFSAPQELTDILDRIAATAS